MTVRPKTPELDDTIVAEGLTPAASVLPRAPDSMSALSGATSFGEHQLIAGRYELLALVGVGGMGAVYRVRDTRLDELVALKILRGELVATPGMQQRFHDEVKLARKVTHRNVARTFDIGDHNGVLFLTMELLDGESLGARLQRETALDINLAIGIAIDIAHGLGAAHAAGVVHRDLKPDNVFLTGGRAVVTDFGIAHTSSVSHGGTTGAIVGTPAYMAPEQIEGRTHLDGRTDLYALGEVIYEMVTGALAWPAADPMASMAARLLQPPPDPRERNRDVSPALAAIVHRLLARSPDDRFATAAEVVAVLTSAKSSAKASVRPVDKGLVFWAETRGEKTVAVLPFKSQGAPDWAAQGLLEDLIDTLSMTRGLRVRPVGVVASFAGTQKAARDVGRELGVSVVIEGSIRAVGTDLRLSTRAISVDDGFQIWAQRWQRPAAEILDVSDQAARAIADALTGSLLVPERGTQDPLAAEMYLRARAEQRAAYHSKERTEKVVGLFDTAVSLAPKDPHVLSGAALSHARLAFFSDGAQITVERERAQEFADRAIAIAPHLGDPWVAVATLRSHDADFVGAGRALASALRFAPNTAKARELLGSLLLEVGELDQGIDLLLGALELDPSCIDPRWDLVRGLGLRGDLDRAWEVVTLPCADTSVMQRARVRARLALWYPDERSRAIVLAEKLPVPGVLAMVVDTMQQFFRTGKLSDENRAFYDMSSTSGSIRVRLIALQAYAEITAAAKEDVAMSLVHVRNAVDLGLLDAAWMDGCPLLGEMRKEPSWPELRGRVEERAMGVRAAVRE